jgi:hypothetical protein
LEFILELKMHPKSHCLTLGTACGHFDPASECLKNNAKGNRFFPELLAGGGGGQKEHGGRGGPLVGRNKGVAEANSEGRW